MLTATEVSTDTGARLLPGIPSRTSTTIQRVDGTEREWKARWFSPDGCVVVDGTRRHVFVGRHLIGTFEADDKTTRNVLLVGLSSDPRQKLVRLAEAFELTRETIRRVRQLYEEGGSAALVPGKPTGPKTKATATVRRRVERMFERGEKPGDVLDKVKSRYDIGRTTVFDIHRAWKEKRAEKSESPAADEKEAEQMPLGVGAQSEAAQEADAETEPVRAPESPSTHTSAGTDPADSGPIPPLDTRTKAVKNATDVQHLGVWLLLAMLNRLGLYAAVAGLTKKNMVRKVRLAVDAVVAALAIDQRCVEGVRRLATPTATTLLRTGRMPSAQWVRLVLGKFATGGGAFLHAVMATLYIGDRKDAPQDTPSVFYVDNHMRPYTGKHVVRKGWRMQDKRVRPGSSDYWVHDIDGRPVKRETAPAHGSLTDWLTPLGRWLRAGLGDDPSVLLAFDRAGAFPVQMAELRDAGLQFVTYERRPFPLLSKLAFDREFQLGDEDYRLHESRETNLGKGRGRVRRIAVLTPDERQLNLLAVSDLPAEDLVAIMRGRWCQENGFKHGNERWGFNQLDGRKVTNYSPDTVVPNPRRRRLDNAHRLARRREGDARCELARLEPESPKYAKVEQELSEALEQVEALQADRLSEPKKAPLHETELADDLVFHEPDYKTLLDTIRIACLNAEADLAGDLAPLVSRPREAKKILANLFTAPGSIRATEHTIRVTLAPAATPSERTALARFLTQLDHLGLTLPGDPSGRRLTFRCPQ